ncbi:hypothetical protein BOTBODRAFT_169022 [Botryobasidium botryosum FD-172 SS1]|uniref:Uncharacterized protein n=1 Tax=Botryobasidium botryosum (strain FD-172 SS1) TaxID=930990 RepID=A0A067N1Z0_BOTB1|nr:hypothetical protein BOTBODRAFT_169022 [Botryobasidium botryosum FD-172 SS1]
MSRTSSLAEKSLLPHPGVESKPRHHASPVLVIHGGAGTMSRERSTPEQREVYRETLREALRAGHAVLQAGGEAMDAAIAAVAVLEGKGAVFNVDGKNELEASLMLSKPPASHPSIPATRRGLALTLLTRARNPSKVASALYLSPDLAPHALLSGSNAEHIGEQLGEQLVDPSYFWTERRWKEHRSALGLPETPYPPGTSPSPDEPTSPFLDQLPTGTVGAVALDTRGCISCVTSTGGRTNKLVGRIGDTPSMGSGFWAEQWEVKGKLRRAWRKVLGKRERAVGVSGTGDGDYFIRQAAAVAVAHRMRFHHDSLSKASRHVVEDLKRNGGSGGLIALDDEGNVAMPLNSTGMYRGVIRKDGVPKCAERVSTFPNPPPPSIDTMPPFLPPAAKRKAVDSADDSTARKRIFALDPNNPLGVAQNRNAQYAVGGSTNQAQNDWTESYWTVQWRKPQTKKHKTWEGKPFGDGVLVQKGSHCSLLDFEGKSLGSGKTNTKVFESGMQLTIGGREIELDSSISRADYYSGACFNGCYVPGGSKSVSTTSTNAAPTVSRASLKFAPFKPPTSKFNPPVKLPAPKVDKGKQREVVPEDDIDIEVVIKAEPGSISTSYWTANWRKPQERKHKTWDGDGIVKLAGTTLSLLTEKGKLMGSRTWKSGMLSSGSTFSVDGKDVEIDAPLSPTAVESGSYFKSHDQITSTIHNTSPVKPFVPPQAIGVAAASFYGSPKVVKAKPRHDPEDDNAIVMPAPNQQHQKRDNLKKLPIVPVVIDPFIGRRLRPHQIEGVRFMYESVMGMRQHEGNGCILADEMGLGKTLQTITLLWTLLKQNPYGGANPVVSKALIVCPVSLINNWKQEIWKWLGRDRIGVFIGDKDKAHIMQFMNRSAYYFSSHFTKWLTALIFSKIHQVLIIGYEKLRKVIAELAFCVPPIGLIICDEGHRLKSANNRTTKMFEALKTPRRIILSGTPIQNDLSEFHAMVDFCNPGLLGDYKSFHRLFVRHIMNSRRPNCPERDRELGVERAEALQETSKSFVLRRPASILSGYLPDKYEYVVFARPTALQLSMLKKILRPDTVDSLIRNSTANSLAVIRTLTKLCTSPVLVRKKGGEVVQNDSGAKQSVMAALELLPSDVQEADLSLSGKLSVLANLLEAIFRDTDEKCVVVSHFTSTLDIIESFCQKKRYTYHRLDGKTKPEKRQQYVDGFNKSSQAGRFLFLLSSKAGGVGINLIGASRLMLVDGDWNPSHDLQSMARIHRDGQKRPVYIYRLLTCGTIDEKIYQRQVTKMGLSESMISTGVAEGGNSSKGDSFSPAELRDLFTVHAESMCHTHELLGCQCHLEEIESSPPEDLAEAAPRIKEDDDDDEMEEEFLRVESNFKKLATGFMPATQVVPEKLDGANVVKRKKAELAALDQWTHIDCLRAPARIQDTILRKLMPKVSSMENEDDEDDEDMIPDVEETHFEHDGKVTFVFERRVSTLTEAKA